METKNGTITPLDINGKIYLSKKLRKRINWKPHDDIEIIITEEGLLMRKCINEEITDLLDQLEDIAEKHNDTKDTINQVIQKLTLM